jgi:DNA-directed RNA polymerase subunit RPC12/RpoP
LAVENSNADRALRCARCGADRLIPLTVPYSRAEYRLTQQRRRPVHAELKCIACGHRARVHPRVLLARAT